MLLVLLRHGPAVARDPDAWPDDSRRPLTRRGEERTRRAVRGLARLLEDEVRALCTSPSLRCVQTARIAAEALGCRRAIEPELRPGGSPRALLERLPAAGPDDVVVLVGHEPGLGRLAGLLVTGKATALPLKKAGACAIACDGRPASGKGRLEWHLTPRLLRRLGEAGR